MKKCIILCFLLTLFFSRDNIATAATAQEIVAEIYSPMHEMTAEGQRDYMRAELEEWEMYTVDTRTQYTRTTYNERPLSTSCKQISGYTDFNINPDTGAVTMGNYVTKNVFCGIAQDTLALDNYYTKVGNQYYFNYVYNYNNTEKYHTEYKLDITTRQVDFQGDFIAYYYKFQSEYGRLPDNGVGNMNHPTYGRVWYKRLGYSPSNSRSDFAVNTNVCSYKLNASGLLIQDMTARIVSQETGAVVLNIDNLFPSTEDLNPYLIPYNGKTLTLQLLGFSDIHGGQVNGAKSYMYIKCDRNSSVPDTYTQAFNFSSKTSSTTKYIVLDAERYRDKLFITSTVGQATILSTKEVNGKLVVKLQLTGGSNIQEGMPFHSYSKTISSWYTGTSAGDYSNGPWLVPLTATQRQSTYFGNASIEERETNISRTRYMYNYYSFSFHVGKNLSPTLTLSSTNIPKLAAEPGLNLFSVQGYVSDPNNQTIRVTAKVGTTGIEKSVTVIKTSMVKPFEINFDVISDQLPNGTHMVTVTADDGWGGIDTKYFSITVQTRASDNLYLTLNDIIYYDTTYDDPESDIQSSERWKFVHNQNFFENPLGVIPDHDGWRSSPYTQFTRTGHYKITFQGMDTLPTIPEFQLWSRDSFDTLNLYVHRKPVPQFTIAVYKNTTGGFPTIIDDTSYDLDKQSLLNGIADREWSWKDSTATVWTSGQPPVNLTIDHSYDVKLRVKDHQGLWSIPLIKSFTTTGAPILLNNPPVATMTNPSGTQAAPTIFSTLRPTLSWTQTDPDAATVFKSFEIQVTNEANTATIFNSGAIAQNTAATSRSWAVTNDLPAGQKLRTRVRVNDGLIWSAWSAQTWMYINRPPVADFDWFPKPVWEGDTITLTNQSTDLDGDALTYSWNITGPASYTFTAATTHVLQKFVLPGDYTVRLTVSDGRAQESVTHTIRVQSLTLEADVGYTALWLEHHLSMGHETVTNPKSFYTGEVFVVSAVGALAATRQVTASLDAIGRDGRAIAIYTNLVATKPANHFQGNLYDPILSSLTGSLPEGQYQIQFSIEYMNGVVKEVNIPIQIIGHVQGATNVHRVQ